MKCKLPTTKGILFGGCSFTWGQGLHYYSNLSSLKDTGNTYDPVTYNGSHVEYIKSVRFPRLVANHFNTFEIVHPYCGGSHDSIIRWWTACFNEDVGFRVDNTPIVKYDYNDISHVVFQLTQPHRCPKWEYQAGKFISYGDAFAPENRVVFYKWLKNTNMDIDEYINYYTRESLNTIKNFLKSFEERNIKVIVLTWPQENVTQIKKDPWFTERFMQINYGSRTYESMASLMEEHPDMKLAGDFENFSEPSIDEHPSLKLHRVMAKNIIERIENE